MNFEKLPRGNEDPISGFVNYTERSKTSRTGVGWVD